MISATQIKNGIATGVVHFIVDPNIGSGTVCAIGENWFYFGDEATAEYSPDEYLAHVPVEKIATDIMAVLDDFLLDEAAFGDEYKYYEAVLKEAEATKGRTVWTVSIKDREDAEMDIWTASFSSEERADAFKAAAEEKLGGYGVFQTVDVTKDCSELDDVGYLDWIDDRYGEQEVPE